MSPALTRRATGVAQILPLAPAAFAVHQLRYLLAYGTNAGLALRASGHSYLHSLAPWVVLVLALIAGGFLRALGRAFAGQRTVPRYTLSLAAMWAACAATLVAIFVGQELLEGFFATGHASGLNGVFGYGGWWAVPAAGCIGLVLAAWLHGARWVIREVARRRAAVRPLRFGPPVLVPRCPALVLCAAPEPLLGGSSSRGPPV